MNNTLVSIIFLFFYQNVQSQCDSSYVFLSQEDVDSFQIRYGPCSYVDRLTLDDRGQSDIENVDALIGLTEIGYLRVDAPTLQSLSGFENLTKVDELIFLINDKDIEYFENLDTIGHLQHTFFDTSDLSLYRNVEYINRVRLAGDGHFSGLDRFIPHRSLQIWIAQNSMNPNLNDILKGYSNLIQQFTLTQCSNFDLSALESMDSIDWLSFNNCTNLDLSPVLDMAYINKFGYGEGNEPLHFGNGFSQINSLDYLLIGFTTEMEGIEEIFPLLNSVKHQIVLRNNESLNNLDLLSKFPPLERTKLNSSFKVYLSVINNPELEVCSNQFICDAVREFKFPDSLLIYGNGTYCQIDILKKSNCLTLNSKDHSKSIVHVYPNPTYGEIYVEGISKGNYEILDFTGRVLSYGSFDQGWIRLDRLTYGACLIRIQSGNDIHVTRIVKE